MSSFIESGVSATEQLAMIRAKAAQLNNIQPYFRHPGEIYERTALIPPAIQIPGAYRMRKEMQPAFFPEP